jgi:prepilin-type processing-associated H-X9-DG protein
MQYTQDYDEKLPVNRWRSDDGNTRVSWFYAVQPYLKSNQLLICPSDSGTANVNNYWNQAPAPQIHVSYGYNGNLGNGDNPNPPTAVSLAAINSAATTVMAADLGADPDTSKPATEWVVRTNSPVTLQHANHGDVVGKDDFYAAPVPRHLETSTVLWADGHVKSLRVDKFYNASGASPCLNPATGCQ